MTIAKNAFSENQLEALSANGVSFDFNKDYSIDEISELEEKIGNIVCDHAYSSDLEFYERIIDIFVELQD